MTYTMLVEHQTKSLTNSPLTYSWPKPVDVPVMKKTRGDIVQIKTLSYDEEIFFLSVLIFTSPFNNQSEVIMPKSFGLLNDVQILILILMYLWFIMEFERAVDTTAN